MGGGEAGFEEQPHRVALITKARLHADEGIAEHGAKHMDARAIGLLAARRRAPGLLNLRQPALAADMGVGGDAMGHIGQCAILLRIALEDAVAQRIHALRHIDGVAGGLQCPEGIVQRFEHREIRGGAGIAGIGREIEDDERDLARRALPPAQIDQLAHAGGQHGRALHLGQHPAATAHTIAARAWRGPSRDAAAAAIGDGRDGTIEFGDGHHHCGLDRRQAGIAGAPGRNGLELQRMGQQIGHIEPGEDFLGRLAVIIGRAANQAETGERDDGIHRRHAILHEVFFDGRATVEPGHEGRHDIHAARLHGGDCTIIMASIARQHIAAQKQHAHPTTGLEGRQVRQRLGHPPWHVRVIEAHLGIFDRRRHLDLARQLSAAARGIPVHQHADHIGDIVRTAGEPVLHAQEIRPHILRGAGDEAQQLGQFAQHTHLARTGGSSPLALIAAQLLQQRHRALRFLTHIELADAGELHHLGAAHQVEHGVTMRTAGSELRQNQLRVVFQEQHGGDHDIGAGNGGVAMRQFPLTACPFISGMNGEFQAGNVPAQHLRGLTCSRTQVAVHRDKHDFHGRRFISVHNGPSHRRGFRP